MNQIIIVVAAHAEVSEGQYQFAAIDARLYQLLAADGDAGMVDGCRHAQVRAIEGQGTFGQGLEHVVLFGPQPPLGIKGCMIPGQ